MGSDSNHSVKEGLVLHVDTVRYGNESGLDNLSIRTFGTKQVVFVDTHVVGTVKGGQHRVLRQRWSSSVSGEEISFSTTL